MKTIIVILAVWLALSYPVARCCGIMLKNALPPKDDHETD